MNCICSLLIVLICLIFFELLQSHNTIENATNSRKLQFDGMFENSAHLKTFGGKKKKSAKVSGRGGKGGVYAQQKKMVSEIINGLDRYHLWWTGPPDSETNLKVAAWGKQHSTTAKNVIFTVTLASGTDKSTCSSPNNLRLFLGSARRAFALSAAESVTIKGNTSKPSTMEEDIVIAVDSPVSPEVLEKNTLKVLCPNKHAFPVLFLTGTSNSDRVPCGGV